MSNPAQGAVGAETKTAGHVAFARFYEKSGAEWDGISDLGQAQWERAAAAAIQHAALATPRTDSDERTAGTRSGFVYVGPDGEPFWPSAKPTEAESRKACFGPCDEWRLSDLKREGWRCEPITLGSTPAPSSPGVPDSVREALTERDDAIRTLEVWFDTSTKAAEQIVPKLTDALVGYLRTCRCGGMPSEVSDMIEAGTADFLRRRAGYIVTPVIEAMVAERVGTLAAHPAGQSTGLGADPVETVARALYEHDNRGLRDVWAWDADGLEEEHPGTRERYERQAVAALKAIGAEETEDDLDRRIARTGARENMQLIDGIADLIGLPHDVELQVSHVREALAKPAPDSTRTGQVGEELREAATELLIACLSDPGDCRSLSKVRRRHRSVKGAAHRCAASPLTARRSSAGGLSYDRRTAVTALQAGRH